MTPQIKRRILNTTIVFSIALMHLGIVALANELGFILPNQANSNVEITLQNDLGNINPADVLQVFVGKQDACCAGKSPIAGRYFVVGRKVTFDPAFDFIEGQHYMALVRHKNSKNNIRRNLKEFVIQPSTETTSPKVVMIYPSGSELPENTLRFYIHFSTPMKPHLSTEFIKLIDENGKSDNAAFMKFKQELWSEDRKRLTLLMDPGRIKRNLAQNLTLGPALLEGKTYSIVIAEGWPSANGEQKIPRFEKKFTITPALRQLPDVTSWKIEPPKTSTLNSLKIKFDRLFDHQLAQSGIRVLNHEGNLIPGKVSIEDNEKTWSFHPEKEWSSSSIQLSIDARLEDVAGNNFKDLLDHSVGTDTKRINQIKFTVELNSKVEY